MLTETAYYLGWKYPMYEVGWLAHSLYEASRPGGRLLLVNTISTDEAIMSPWLIRSYHDLFSNVGYLGEREETMRGVEERVEFEILIPLFAKATGPSSDRGARSRTRPRKSRAWNRRSEPPFSPA